MRPILSLFLCTILSLTIVTNVDGQSQVAQPNLQRSIDVSLDGQALRKGSNSSALHLVRTKVISPKGIVLVLPGDGNKLPKVKNECAQAASFLNSEGFDVAVLENGNAKNSQGYDQLFMDALKAYRMLKSKGKSFSLRGDRMAIMGFGSGGQMAAKLVRRLNDGEQPDGLILISPSGLNETLKGTVFYSVMPPVHPQARLFVTFFASENKDWIRSGLEYSKTWKGYDGEATFRLIEDSVNVSKKNFNPLDNHFKLREALKLFLQTGAESKASTTNPAAVPVAGSNTKRHAAKLEAVAKEKFDLIMIGNSITNNLEKPAYQPVWNQFFAPRKALNLGYSGYRTENILWNIQNGELEGQSPKVIVLEIGTNNVDEKNYPTRHTAGQLAGGIEAIVKQLRDKLPDTKIIVLRCFPGCYGGPNPTSHRAILERASDMVSQLADGKHVFYCDVNHVFINLDGSINHEMMADWLHPTPAGAKAWAQAMEPLLAELMGDKSLDTEIPANSAIVPVSKLENDSYNWWDRHAEVLRIKDSINPEIVLIGNSITHFWGGEPRLKNADGKPRTPNGPKAWDSVFGNYRVLNLGFGWDRTQNVLWRLDHGELDALHPRTVIIHIGTNNTSQTKNARMNTAPEIVEAIRAICTRVRSKVPGAKIILMAIMPREQSPATPRRILINEINRQLIAFANEQKITLVDIGPKMLAPDGTLPKEIAGDFCHPTEKGYLIWADGIRSLIAEP